MTRPFSVRHRADEIAEASTGELDVLVVGLGATGAGVALDAASRGLRVAAVDRGDLAAGTSSKSSKLIHGGLRYLEHYEFSLVHEGVSERQVLQRLAPHLVRPMDFVYPVWPDTAKRRLLGLGLTTYDVFAGMHGMRRQEFRRHERINAEEAVERAPALAGSGLRHAYVYGDCATDDARLVLAVVREARRFGALTLPYAEVVGLLRGKDGQVVGAKVHDRLTGDGYEIRARHVVNATGVWVDGLLAMADEGHAPAVQPSKGVHVVVPRERLPLEAASVLLPSRQGDGRSMFAIPWGRQTILGTTDTAYDGPLDALALEREDLDYVIAAGNAVFRRGLTEDDVIAAWVGARPLLRTGAATGGDGGGESGGSGRTLSDVSRRHSLTVAPSGLVTITGGKLTTYRRMAADVVDLLVEKDGRRARCRTAAIPLGCARPLDDVVAEARQAARAVRSVSSPRSVPSAWPAGPGGAPSTDEVADLLVRQHGEAAPDVLALVAADPALGDPLSPAAPHLLAEVVYAARYEGAATLEDVFGRRTRLSLRVRDAALPAAPRAARLLADELGRPPSWADEQVEAYADAVGRERGVLGRPVERRLAG